MSSTLRRIDVRVSLAVLGICLAPLLAGCHGSTSHVAKPERSGTTVADDNCGDTPSTPRVALVLSNREPSPQVRVPVGALVVVRARYHGLDLLPPSAAPHHAICVLSRGGGSTARAEYVVTRSGTITVGTGDAHPGPQMDPALLGKVVVQARR